MTDTITLGPPPVSTPPSTPPDDPSRRVDWRRLKGPVAGIALTASLLSTIGPAVGSLIAGRLSAGPTGELVLLLAIAVVGGSLLDIAGRVIWSGVVDQAEGRLREDLLAAALHQPLSALNEQAVGEILDRVDDDTHEVGTLLRLPMWFTIRALFGLLPMWIVAGITWWPSWFVFPVFAGLTAWSIRPLLGEIARRKVVEEMAWTDHAAGLEEGIAGRDDLRTSLGQAFVIRRVARLASAVHTAFERVVLIEARLTRRAGVLLHALLAGAVVLGAYLVSAGTLSVPQLVTLFMVTAMFVGQIDQMAHRLPDLQAGLGALMRIRQLLEVEPEPVGGAPVPPGRLDLEFRDLHFSYDEGSFALSGVSLHVPAGQTIALVGRTGSGKSTLASLISRALEPEPGTVLVGGVDVCDLDLQRLRAAVGTVTQRTEIIAGTLADNITLFDDEARERVDAAVDELGLTDWVAGLPQGLDTLLGPGGTRLSAGEEQLVAFARLLVRDVEVVVLDEATARMDPLTEARVVAAAERLLARRTGVIVAHRLSTVERADLVAVLDHGRVIQFGTHAELAASPGRFRVLLEASADHTAAVSAAVADDPDSDAVGGRRRVAAPPERPPVPEGPSLARGIAHAISVRPWWGAWSVVLFLLASLFAAQGAVSGWVWGMLVEDLRAGEQPSGLVVALVLMLISAPLLISDAVYRYPRWWVEVLLRSRMAVLVGQTRPRRLERTPPGEVVARAMDADRFARYADRWVDFTNAILIAVVTMVVAGTALAGGVLVAVMVSAALASAIGRPIAGRSAAKSSAARARFGRALVSSLESARTVKLAARTPQVHAHLHRVDGGRVRAAVFEHRVQALLDGIPMVMVQLGVVTAWAAYLWGVWGLATALLVANAVNGFDWFGRVAGAVVTEAPGTRAWQQVMSAYAGGTDLMDLPQGVDLVSGDAPAPQSPARTPLTRLEVSGLTAIHDDGTIGVSGVDLTVEAGELVLLLGQVGSGKSSLLSALAGLVDHHGSVRWNGEEVDDAEAFLRPAQVAHVAQVPRVLSGSFTDNVQLGFDRPFRGPVSDARLESDVAEAGGPDAVVGHRGVRLSGGQVQRLALARALATESELLLADDVSSALDAATEIELWDKLRARKATVIGATSKRAALALADRVVVLVDGEVAATGHWSELAGEWGHLAG